jgi:hypothetical protein
VNNVLSGAVIGACLIGALWAAVLAGIDRQIGNGVLVALAIAEVLVFVQLVVAVVEVISGKHPDSTVTFLAYAVGELVIMPIGLFWSLAEKSRSSTLVITVAGVAVAVMTARMFQMWGTVGG